MSEDVVCHTVDEDKWEEFKRRMGAGEISIRPDPKGQWIRVRYGSDAFWEGMDDKDFLNALVNGEIVDD